MNKYENKYEENQKSVDDYFLKTNDYQEWMDLVQNIKKQTRWIETNLNLIHPYFFGAFGPMEYESIRKNFNTDFSTTVLQDTANNSQYFMRIFKDDYLISSETIPLSGVAKTELLERLGLDCPIMQKGILGVKNTQVVLNLTLRKLNELKQQKIKLLVRFDKIRGILSKSYTPINIPDLWDITFPIMSKFLSGYYDHDYCRYRLGVNADGIVERYANIAEEISQNLGKKVHPQFYVEISSSDTAGGAVTVYTGFLIGTTYIRFRKVSRVLHVGHSLEEVKKLLASALVANANTDAIESFLKLGQVKYPKSCLAMVATKIGISNHKIDQILEQFSVPQCTWFRVYLELSKVFSEMERSKNYSVTKIDAMRDSTMSLLLSGNVNDYDVSPEVVMATIFKKKK
jgi:hypothetical protein